MLSYSIVDASSPFVVDASSGVLTANRSFDRESQAFYTITVQVADNGKIQRTARSRVDVTISDVNDIVRARLPHDDGDW